MLQKSEEPRWDSMRYMDASNVTIPAAAAARPYSGLPAAINEGLSHSNTKQPLTLSSCDTNFKSHNGLNLVPGILPPVHFLPEKILCSLKPWTLLGKETASSSSPSLDIQGKASISQQQSNNGIPGVKEVSSPFLPQQSVRENSDDPLQLQYGRNSIHALSCLPRRLLDAPMNGAEKLGAMTGNSNPHPDPLNWLSEATHSAAAASKGTTPNNKHAAGVTAASPSPNRNDHQPPPVALHTVRDCIPSQLLLSSSSGSIFSPPIVVARPLVGSGGLRMFTPPPLQMIERTQPQRHGTTTVSGSLYYSQASRTVPVSSGFFQATSYTQASQLNVSSLPVNNPQDASRSYLQVNNYSPLPATHHVVGSSSSQLSCSPSYLQQPPSTLSPVSLAATSSSHDRMFQQQGRSILISRSPEAMIIHSSHERDPPTCQIQIQLSSPLTLPPQQSQDEATMHQKSSFTSNDLALVSSSCSPVVEISQGISADFPAVQTQQRTLSPSHIGYRLPTGKEGSLKHRILRPPSIHILDPPHSVVAEAPLSAPPIRTTHHRELSPKQARSVPSSGYRSFSSSASSITEASSGRMALLSPGGGSTATTLFPNNHHHCSSSYSSSECPSPLHSPATAQLKYPQSFVKGSIIQLASNRLKQVEDMTTEDFVECGLLSPTLQIDSSTVTRIERTPCTGAARLGFHVGQDNIQITVEAPLEHPFFVYKQGWSSCSPERSAQRYGLTCHKLKVGDVCISLTDKPRSTTGRGGGQKVTNNHPVPLSSSVPSVVSDSNQNACTAATDRTKEDPPVALSGAAEPSSLLLGEKKMTTPNTNQQDSQNKQVCTGKRKRRWSAPDNLSQNES